MIYAATGHRPNKLGGYGPEATAKLVKIARDFLSEEHEVAEVISGMALGWDMAWAEAALDLSIPLTAAVPFKGQELVWPDESKKRYHRILQRASHYIDVSPPGYAAWKMQRRNEFMVDRCDVLVALYNGDLSGGTFNCITYAKKMERQIINLWDKFNV